MTTNRIIAMLKRKDFVICDIRTDRIQHIEKLISNTNGGTPLEYDLWRTVVLPIRHILGRVPLMRLYLAESVQPTIPHWHSLAGDKDPCSKHGCADRAGRSGIGLGSRLFEINVHLWQYVSPGGLCQSRSAWTAKRRV
jgi:hypothetical protein